jgi:hypothetical protein
VTAPPYVRRPRYPAISLSYRRADSEALTGRLQETLSREFGDDDVFMDQFSILPGEPYPWAIQQAAAHCDVLIAVMGPSWLEPGVEVGKRRLDLRTDLLRREVTAALDRGTRVIPVLLPGATIPTWFDLPEGMHGLQLLQAIEIGLRHWRTETAELICAIRQTVGDAH